jgi:hypothetical protein
VAPQLDKNVIINAEVEYSMSVLDQLRVHLATLGQDGTTGNLSQCVSPTAGDGEELMCQELHMYGVLLSDQQGGQ